MKKEILLLFWVIFLLGNIVSAQTFQQTNTAVTALMDRPDTRHDATSDGGQIWVGTVDNAGNKDILVTKMKADGKVQWSNRYGGTGNENAGSVAQLSDGSFIISGSTNSFSTNYQAFLLKLTSAGYVSFVKTYQADNTFHHATFVRPLTDGFVVAGTNNFEGSIGTQENLGRVFGFKTDLNGNLTWMRSWNTGRQRANLREVQATTDTSFVFVGNSGHNRDYMGVLIIKTETNGNLKWSKVIRSTAGCNTPNCWSATNLGIMLSAQSLVVNSDNSYTIAGGVYQGNNPIDWNWTYSFKRGYLLKVSKAGAVVFSNVINLTGASTTDTHEYFDILKNTDGSYVLGGSLRDEKSILANFTSAGAPSWAKSYTNAANSKITSVDLHSDGKLSAFGYRSGQFAGYKVNADGTNGTCATTETASILAYPVDAISFTVTPISTGIVVNRAFTRTNICQTQTAFCGTTATTAPPLALQLGSPDTVICIGTTLALNLSAADYDSVIWSNGSRDEVFSTAVAGTYTVTVYKGGCSATDTQTLTLAACPCALTTRGTEFWVGYLESFTNSAGKTLTLTATSDLNATGQVFIGLSATPVSTFNVVAGTSTTIVIPNSAEAVGSETIEAKGIRVTTTNPISLYSLNYTNLSSDATVIYPTETLGTNYFVTTYTQNTVHTAGQRRNSEFMVVATEDNTLVTITPKVVTTGLRPANTPFNVTLNRGQVYEVQSGNIWGTGIVAPVMPAGQGDLTGSRVQSDKKVAVFGGNFRTLVPNINTCCWDNLYQQTPPVRTWGKDFITVPYLTRSWDVFRILASENTTTVNITGIGAITLNSGQFYEFNTNGSNTPRTISSDKVISVTQFSTSGSTDGAQADPFMITLNPTIQTLSNITFVAFNSTVINNYYLNVLCKTSVVPFVVYNGASVSASFTPVPTNPTYSYARLNIVAGTHNINTGTNTDGLIAYVYGYGNAESYGYATGGNMQTVLDIGPPGIGGDTTLCYGSTLNIGTNSTEFSSFLWNTGATTPTIDITTPGVYWIRGVDIVGCQKTDTLNVNFVAPPADIKHLGVSVDTIRYCDEEGAQVFDASNPAYTSVTYSWTILGSTGVLSTADTLLANNFSDTTTYVITITDLSTPLNCVVRDTVTAIFFPTPQIQTGNGFSLDTIRWCNDDGPQVIGAGNNPNSFAVSYEWRNLTTGLVISTTREITVSNFSSTTQYEVTMIDLSNSIPCGSKDTITVIFRPSPIVNITHNSISTDHVFVCFSDGAQTLDAYNITHGLPGRMLYKWYRNSNYSTVIGTGATLSVPNTFPTALYTVVVIDAIDTTFCQTADSVEVTFNPNPTAEIKFGGTAAANVLYFCNSAGIKTLSGSHTSHTASTQYQWYIANNPAALVPVGTSSSLNVNNFSDSIKYLLVVTDASKPTNCKSYDSVKVVYTADPVAEIFFNGISSNSAAYCLSAGLQLLTAVSSVPGVTYQWIKQGSGPIAGATNPELTVLTSGVYIVQIRDVSRPSNCLGTDEITITVTPNPDTNLPDTTTICTTTGTLSVTQSGMHYAWTGPAGLVESTQTIDVFNSGWHYVTITDPATLCFSRDSTYVRFSTPPNAAITYNHFAVCAGTPLVLSAYDPEHINDGGVTYLWNTGANTPTITVNGSGLVTYTVIIKRNIAGCQATATVTVDFKAPPTITIPNVVYYCEPQDSIGFSLSAAYSYIWSGPGIIGDSLRRLIVVNDTGNYTITAIDLLTNCRTIKTIKVLKQEPPVSGLSDTVYVCQNKLPAKISAKDISHGSHIGYKWYYYTDLNVVIDTNAVLTATLAGTYIVKIYNRYSACFTLDTVALKIAPAPNFAIMGYDGPHCSRGDTLFVQMTNLTNMMIKWYGPSIIGATNGTSIKVNASGIYTVTVTDTSTTARCSNSRSIAVIVNANPKSSIDKSATYVVCEGEKRLIDAYNPSHSPTTSYKWIDLRDNKVLSDSAKLYLSTLLYTTPTYEEFRIRIEMKDNALGCAVSDTILAQFKRKTNVSIKADKTEICLGETILLTADGASYYKWLTKDTTRQILWTPTEVGYYTMTVQGNYFNGCNPTVATMVFKINPKPKVDLPPFLEICQNDTIHVSGFDFSNPKATIYSWKNLENNSVLSTSANFDLHYNAFGAQTYDTVRIELTVTDSLTGCFSKDTTTAKFHRAATAKITSSDEDFKICLGDSVLLVANGGTEYLWNTDDDAKNYNDSIWVKPDKIGYFTYRVAVSYLNVCKPALDSVTFTVFRAPRVRAHTSDVINLCADDEIWLLPSGAVTYKWEHDPNLEGSIKVSPKESTTYYVIGTNENGCSARDSVFVYVTPTIKLPKTVAVCEGESVVIGAESPVPATYIWEPGGEKTAKISVKEEGTYTVTVTVDSCIYTRSVFVQQLERPQIILAADTTLCFEDENNNFEQGQRVLLPQIINKQAGVTYLSIWRNDENEIISSSDTLIVTKPGKYHLKVIAVFGNTLCENANPFVLNITELCPPRIYIPQAFTPNNDGLNDRFKIFGSHVFNFKMTIYNRWNEVVHTVSGDKLEDIADEKWWDGFYKGAAAIDGQYAWTISYETEADAKREKIVMQGALMIVR